MQHHRRSLLIAVPVVGTLWTAVFPLMWSSSFLIDCAVSTTVFGNVLVVSTGCHEPPGHFNPPVGRYRHFPLHCNESLVGLDARETSLILRFARDFQGRVEADRVIFCHAHDLSRHLPGLIWDIIDRVTRTKYFWSHDYGNLVSRTIITTKFFTDRKGVLHTWTTNHPGWIAMHFLVEFLFAETSLARCHLTQPVWRTPCCSTFFVDPKLLMRRTPQEYETILDRIHWLARHPHSALWMRTIGSSSYPTNKLRRHVVVGEVLERAWGVIFTGRGDPELHATLDQLDRTHPDG
jgi:hypothetical protein